MSRTWLVAPVPAPMTISMVKDVDPVGEPKVLPDPFCTLSVAPLGAEEAPSRAKRTVNSARTASRANGMRLRRGTRQR